MSNLLTKKDPLNASIAIVGLDSNLTQELVRALSLGSHMGSVRTHEKTTLNLQQFPVDIVFCASNPERCLPLIEAVRRHQPHVPVVVVSRDAEFGEWLTAMEAGASDYCMAPFDPMQLRWILASHVNYNQLAA